MGLKKISLRELGLVTIVFWLFQKNVQPDDPAEVVELDEDDAKFNHIRCPLCQWRPSASSKWICLDCDYPEYFFNSCGTSWNTFSTGGRCPGCGHQWRWTACLRCSKWSLHEDWYPKN